MSYARARSMRLGLSSLALAACLVIGATPRAQAEGRAVELRSAYLGTPVLGGRQIKLQGAIPGAASLHLDPNRCSLDAFGDPRICTRMAARAIEVRIVASDTADPTGGGRTLFDVRPRGAAADGGTGDGSVLQGTTVALVKPGAAGGVWRLIVTPADDGAPSVVPMMLGARQPSASGAPCKLGMPVGYLATFDDGRLTVVAEGQAPTPGWTFAFEVVRERSGVPTYRLTCTAPKGIVPQVLAPFRWSQTFDVSSRGAKPIEQIVVIDGRGRHTVRVAPLRDDP